jgi:hypothetical protein
MKKQGLSACLSSLHAFLSIDPVACACHSLWWTRAAAAVQVFRRIHCKRQEAAAVPCLRCLAAGPCAMCFDSSAAAAQRLPPRRYRYVDSLISTLSREGEDPRGRRLWKGSAAQSIGAPDSPEEEAPQRLRPPLHPPPLSLPPPPHPPRRRLQAPPPFRDSWPCELTMAMNLPAAVRRHRSPRRARR